MLVVNFMEIKLITIMITDQWNYNLEIATYISRVVKASITPDINYSSKSRNIITLLTSSSQDFDVNVS